FLSNFLRFSLSSFLSRASRWRAFMIGAAGLAVAGCSGSTSHTGAVDAAKIVPMTTALTGCAGAVPPMVPGGYYVNGNTICTADGRPHLFHGLDRPSLEWTANGEKFSAADFALMASWKANVV